MSCINNKKMSLNYVLTSHDCFGLHINITHPAEKTENLLPIVDFNHLSLADYHKERNSIFPAASKKKKIPISPSDLLLDS